MVACLLILTAFVGYGPVWRAFKKLQQTDVAPTPKHSSLDPNFGLKIRFA